MESVNANPITIVPRQASTRQSTTARRSSSLKSLIVSIALLVGLVYGMSQVYVAYTFYETVMNAGSKLERMMDDPHAFVP